MGYLLLSIVIFLAVWGMLSICGVRTSLGLLVSFLPGEKVLLFQRWIWLGSAKSKPSYR